MGRKAAQIATCNHQECIECRAMSIASQNSRFYNCCNASTFIHEKLRIKMIDGGTREIPISRCGNLAGL
jgi:hypothetical protein